MPPENSDNVLMQPSRPSQPAGINPQQSTPQFPLPNAPQKTTPLTPPKKPLLTKKLIIILAILFIGITLAGGGVFAYQKLGNNGLLQNSNCTLTLDEKIFPDKILDLNIFGGIQKGGIKTYGNALVAAGYFGDLKNNKYAEGNTLILKINNEEDIFLGLTPESGQKYREQELTLKAIQNKLSEKERKELIGLVGSKATPDILELKKIGGFPVYMTQDKSSNSGTVAYEDTKTKLIITMITVRTSHSVEEYFTEWQKQVCKKLPPTETKNVTGATASPVIDISNWNLYENAKLGYSIKTPQDFTKDDSLVNSSLGTVIFKSANFKKELVKDPQGSVSQGEHLEAVEGLSIEVRSSPTTRTLDDEYLSRYSDNRIVKNKTSQEPFKLANFPEVRGVRTKYSYQGILPADEVMIVANGHVFLILLNYASNYPENNITQILNSLQLLK